MKISKENLKTLWYEDEHGNELPSKEPWEGAPEGAMFQISQFPFQLTTNHLKLISQKEVDKCRHPRKYIKPTYGWIDGIVGRECKQCGGTQTKRKWGLWPRKWNGYGSRSFFTTTRGWSEDLVLAITNSGDYSLCESILIAATSCERCMNSLAHKYGLNWGYPEYSEEWEKCGTTCRFCENAKE
jgi:hypothetical protein